MSKVHHTVKEIKGGEKGEKERERGTEEQPRFFFSAEKKYVPLRDGSKTPRVCRLRYESGWHKEGDG